MQMCVVGNYSLICFCGLCYWILPMRVKYVQTSRFVMTNDKLGGRQVDTMFWTVKFHIEQREVWGGEEGKVNMQIQCKQVQFICAILFDFFLVWHCVWMFKYLPILQYCMLQYCMLERKPRYGLFLFQIMCNDFYLHMV